MRQSDPEHMRRRLRNRMAFKRLDAAGLARMLEWSARTVQNYVADDGPALPSEFVARCEEKGFCAARWLLLEEGPEDPIGPDELAYRLTVIGRVKDGDVPLEALKRLAQGSAERIADALGDLIGPSSGEA